MSEKNFFETIPFGLIVNISSPFGESRVARMNRTTFSCDIDVTSIPLIDKT